MGLVRVAPEKLAGDASAAPTPYAEQADGGGLSVRVQYDKIVLTDLIDELLAAVALPVKIS